MVEKTQERAGCLYLASVSLAASLLGSAVAAPIVSMMDTDGGQTFPIAFVIFFFGIWIAVPIGLLMGIPMLAVTRRFLPKHVILATPLFSIVGLLGGLVLQDWDGSNGFGNAFAVFGACIGGMHPLVYSRLSGGQWRSILAASLLSGAIVPSVAYAGESVHNMIESRREFAVRCADRYGSMAFVTDRAALERLASRRRQFGQGKWYNQRQWRSLYAWERRVSLDDARILIARDYAYVPSGFAGWITGGRRVERHCLSEKTGPVAAILHRHGFGQRPTLADLED